MPLDITYVMLSAGMSGGAKIALEQATRLEQRGHNVCVYYLCDPPHWFCRRVPGVHFADLESLKRALRAARGIKIATWHETAYWVADCLNPGDLGYYLVQDIEESYYSNPRDARRALQTYRLGLQAIGSGRWPWRQLTSRFGLRALLVRPPVDFDIFYPVPVTRERSRIFTQCRPLTASGQGDDLKGWRTARAAIERAFQLDPATSLVTFSIEPPPQFPPELPHIHLTPSDDQLRELYCQAGVYLMSSNHEGFGLTAAEAMACGCPVVTTRADGNEEFCRDGFTALTAPPGDYETVARHCLTLMHNPDYADRLARNAREFIQQYSWATYVDHLEEEFQRRSLPVEIRPPHPKGPEIEFALTLPRLAAEPARGEYPHLIQEETASCEVSVVIPTINDVDHVVRCIRTCRRHTAGHDVEYLVVDDGSTDPAVVRALEEHSRKVGFRLLRNYQNLGFAASVNHGIRHARGEFVVLVNNDVRFVQPWLEPMLEFMRQDPSTGVAGARLLFEEDSSIQHAGMTKEPGGLLFVHRFGGEPRSHYEAGQNTYIWAVTGALFMIRRSAVKELGGLSTAYGTAWEDVDYCLHAWTRGYRVAYCGQAVAYHGEGKTRGATDAEKAERPLHWAERERAGKSYFFKKWFWLTHLEDFPINSQETLRGAPIPLEGRGADPASFFPTSLQPFPEPLPVSISAPKQTPAPPAPEPLPAPLAALVASSNGKTTMPEDAYEQVVAGVREAVSASIPQHAAVLVVSRGDEELLQLDGRPGWHFPQDPDGTWAGHYPVDSGAAIVHLETLRAKGGAFLVFPSTAFWWLEHYDGFREHLEERYPVVRRDATCVIFALREPKSNGHLRQEAVPYLELVREIQQVVSGTLPAGATVAVVSKGDDALLRLNGCRAWHFPQTEDGIYAGYYPADSVEAIGQLEVLRDRGASHLLFPDTALWWLDHYDRFRQHLDSRYRRVWGEAPCVIYDLTGGFAGREPGEASEGSARLPQRAHSPPAEPASGSFHLAARDYQEWARRCEAHRYDREFVRSALQKLTYRPTVSILLPVHTPPLDHLEQAIASVAAQFYPHWELCVCHASDGDERIAALLGRCGAGEKRIQVTSCPAGAGFAAAANRALAAAGGEFIGLLDPEDWLTPDALLDYVSALQDVPADLLYADDDQRDSSGRRSDPAFKPAWSPEYLLAYDYIRHAALYRSELLRKLGGFREGFEGDLFHDLVLRAGEAAATVAHVPRILYHRRASRQENGRGGGQPDVRSAADALKRRRIAGTAEATPHGCLRVRRELIQPGKVTIIIPTRDRAELLRSCIRSIEENTAYRNYEIVIVDNNSREADALEYLARTPHRVIRHSGPFNFSRLNNIAARETSGDYLLFLNNDTEAIHPEWLSAMVEHAQRPEVGAVGAKLLYMDGGIQHAGVVLGLGFGQPGVAGHAYRGRDGRRDAGDHCTLQAARECSAVTAACLLMRRELFEEIEGMDEGHLPVAFNDVDLCLRLRERGYYVLFTPHACLYHNEAASRGDDLNWREEAYMLLRWQQDLLSDPYYHPSLSLQSENGEYDLAKPEGYHLLLAQEGGDDVAAGLEAGHTIGQRFIAYGESLAAMAVTFATYGRTVRGRVVLHLRQDPRSVEDIRTVEVDASLIEDNQHLLFTFEPVAAAPGTPFYFFVEFVPAGARPLSLWRARKDTVIGSLYLDHERVAGTLKFRAYGYQQYRLTRV